MSKSAEVKPGVDQIQDIPVDVFKPTSMLRPLLWKTGKSAGMTIVAGKDVAIPKEATS